MQLRDVAYQYAFSKLFVYNILWEDSEVDERFLGIDERSRVLGISGAGCGLAGMMSARPERIDAVDINAHHLALAALKMAGTRARLGYGDFYDLFGRGWSSNPEAMVGAVAQALPRDLQRYWRQHSRRFERSVHHRGMTAQMIGQLRRVGEIDARFLLALVPLSVEHRWERIESWFRPLIEQGLVRLLLESPLNLVSLGINFAQRDRILATEGQNLAEFLLSHLKRVAATDLKTNWFAWYAVAGHYDHENQRAVPPFLRRDRWERSQGARTELEFHHRNLFDVLERAPSNVWTHYTLCDAPDWLPQRSQERLLREIFRTSRDGAIVMYRSVEDDCWVQRHGQSGRFTPLEDRSREATELERSKQYRHVRFYQVTH